MQLEDWDKAIEIYTALTKADPADQDAYLTLANAYIAKGDYTKAQEICETAFNAKTDVPMAFVALGKVLQLKRDAAGASEQFKRAANKGKKDINIHRQIGESYLHYIPIGSKRPDLTRAVEKLTEAHNMNSKDVPTLMALGYAYKEQGNGGLAANNYELAEQLEPKNPLPKLMLAKVYKAAKQPERALSYYDKAIAISPNYCPALREKATYLYYSRKWEAATQALKDLVNQCKEVKIEDEMLLANSLYITKDCKATGELVDKILKKDPSKNYLRRLKAYCLYDNGDYQGALDMLNDYFKTAPADKIIATDYAYLGNSILKTKGDTIVAVNNLKKSIEMDSSTWPLWKEIAKTYYNKRMNCESVQAFQMYYDSIPNPEAKEASDIYVWGLAQYYCKDEPDAIRFAKAEQIFKKVTELMPKAGIGWLWAGKAAQKLDPTPEQIDLNPALANEFGKARVYAENYIEVAWADKEKNKKDLILACHYLSYCYWVKKEKANFDAMTAKWSEIDPDNPLIKEMRDTFGTETIAPVPSGGATPTPNGNGGGGANDKNGGGKNDRH
jgi:tetratricopeptide (TPR) repeat protein